MPRSKPVLCKVLPRRICRIDESDLLPPRPTLDLFFPRDRSTCIGSRFDVNEPCYLVTAGETASAHGAMFSEPLNKVAGYTYVERPSATRKQVDVERLHWTSRDRSARMSGQPQTGDKPEAEPIQASRFLAPLGMTAASAPLDIDGFTPESPPPSGPRRSSPRPGGRQPDRWGSSAPPRWRTG